MKSRGLRPWFDEVEIPPGISLQDAFQQAIGKIEKGVICIGESVLKPRRILELEKFVNQCVERNIPLIPLVLPGAGSALDALSFLKEFHSISFKENIEDQQAFDSLEYEIVGKNSLHIAYANNPFSQELNDSKKESDITLCFGAQEYFEIKRIAGTRGTRCYILAERMESTHRRRSGQFACEKRGNYKIACSLYRTYWRSVGR